MRRAGRQEGRRGEATVTPPLTPPRKEYYLHRQPTYTAKRGLCATFAPVAKRPSSLEC